MNKLELIKAITELPDEEITLESFETCFNTILNKKQSLKEILNLDEFNKDNVLLSFHNKFTSLLDVYEISLEKLKGEIIIKILNSNSSINIKNYDNCYCHIKLFITEDNKKEEYFLEEGHPYFIKCLYELIKINIYLRKGNKTSISQSKNAIIYIYKEIEFCKYNPGIIICNLINNLYIDFSEIIDLIIDFISVLDTKMDKWI